MSDTDINKTTAEPEKTGRKRAGRKTDYTDEIAAEICTRISCGESLRQICMEPHMPTQSTVYLWLLRNKKFSENYTRARDEQADTYADEIQAIADERPAEIVDDKGIARVDSAYVNWMRLRIDSRKWVASKLKPKKYGDRTTLAGDADNPVAVTADTSIFDAILKNVELNKQAKK